MGLKNSATKTTEEGTSRAEVKTRPTVPTETSGEMLGLGSESQGK